MNRIIILIILFIITAGQGFAQQGADKRPAVKDTVLVPAAIAKAAIIDTLPFITPKKIGLFSAIVPGLGQFHNKQYWKIPVIYVLVGASAYFLSDNIKNYNGFRKEYANRLSPNRKVNSDYTQYTDAAVKGAMDYYRKNLDLTALLTGVGYTLQVMDAIVFAHLKGFDISQDISLNMRPVMTPQGGMGLGLVMKF